MSSINITNSTTPAQATATSLKTSQKCGFLRILHHDIRWRIYNVLAGQNHQDIVIGRQNTTTPLSSLILAHEDIGKEVTDWQSRNKAWTKDGCDGDYRLIPTLDNTEYHYHQHHILGTNSLASNSAWHRFLYESSVEVGHLTIHFHLQRRDGVWPEKTEVPLGPKDLFMAGQGIANPPSLPLRSLKRLKVVLHMHESVDLERFMPREDWVCSKQMEWRTTWFKVTGQKKKEMCNCADSKQTDGYIRTAYAMSEDFAPSEARRKACCWTLPALIFAVAKTTSTGITEERTFLTDRGVHHNST